MYSFMTYDQFKREYNGYIESFINEYELFKSPNFSYETIANDLYEKHKYAHNTYYLHLALNNDGEKCTIDKMSRLFSKVFVVSIFLTMTVTATVVFLLTDKRVDTVQEHLDHCLKRSESMIYTITPNSDGKK